MRHSSISIRLVELLKEAPNTQTIPTLTKNIYGSKFTQPNYNYIWKLVKTLIDSGKLIKNENGTLGLVDRNIDIIKIPKKMDALPFRVPTLLQNTESIQNLINKDKYLQKVILGIQANPEKYRAYLTEIWPDTMSIEDLLVLAIEVICYLNLMMHTAETPSTFFSLFEVSGEPTDPEETIKRLEYLTS